MGFSLRARRILALVASSASVSGLLAHGPEYISTLAGNGIAGINGDGLAPLNTALYLPQDGAFGPDGGFYFSDWNNHRIRRLRDDVIVTVAGTGELGDAQDGLAIDMKLNHPTNVAFDPQGRMLIACWHNSKVKRVDLSTGMCVNVAGTGARAYGGDDGPANAARLDLPSAVAVDANGNIYISDQANFRLRRVDPAGTITTMCGTGVAGYTGDDGPALQATIKSPVGQSAAPAGRIDMDAEGRIYIADTGNHVIRLIDLDGTIRTIAGTGAAGFSGDDGPATAARLNTPSDVAVTADGTVYIADTRNNRIRKVESGRITTIAGTGVAGFSGDGGLGENAKLDRPYGVAIAPNGDVVIADTHNHRLRILTEEPRDSGPGGSEDPPVIVPCTGEVGSICTYAGTGVSAFNGDGKDRTLTDLYWPFDMEFTPSGRIYVLDWNSHRVRQIMPDATMRTVMGTDFVGDGPPGAADLVPPGVSGLTVDLNHPTDMQEFANGDLMVMAWHNHKIRVLDPLTGLVQVIAGGPVGFVEGAAKDARLNQPPRGTLDANGNLFFIDQRNQRVRFIRDFDAQRKDAMVSTIAGTGTPGFNGDGPALATQFSFPTGTNPEPSGGITISPTGVVYFADTLNNRLRKFQFNYNDFTAGPIETIAGTGTPGSGGDGGPAINAQINYPQDVELGPDGKLYFCDTNNNRIRRIDLESGDMEAVAGTGVEGYSGDGGTALTATFNRPFGIAFDFFGNLYISDTFNSRIRKVKLTTTPEGPEPILPANYSATYVEVRNCRFSLEHGGVYIRVLADPSSAQLYQDNAPQLPVGTVIVKEEYSDDQCEPDELVRWRVMRKESPGYDPEDGDWHWQWLTTRREVVEDTKSTCISCHEQPECVARDRMCALPGNLSEMKLVLDGLPASLLSISGAAPNDGHNHGNAINFDIYAVGADPGDGRGPFVAHYEHNTAKWARLTTGATGDLWWITDRVIDDSFYMAGENGLILRYDLPTGSFERMKTPGGKLLFGVWGTNPQNLWACGGDLSNEDAGGAVWKFNGEEWVVDTQAAAARPAGLPTLYKVWGRDANDVYAVGRLGVVIHWNGANWTLVPTPVTRPLFTVHGNQTRVVATGGAFQGVILELEGNSFVDRTPVGAPQINGVYVSAGPAAVVGAEGTWATRGATGWELKTPVTANGPADFHATWMDGSGGIWAVGGDLTVDQSYGVLAYAGSASVSRQFVSGPCATGVAGPAGTVSFSRQILPLFRAAGCQDIACHGGFPLNPESEYDLRNYETFFGPGLAARNFGMCEIVPGNPDASYILEKLMPSPRVGAQMPNELPPLTPQQFELVRTWIQEGAIDDTPLPGSFSRGDVDANGTLNITDPISIFNYLFLNGGALACIDAGDLNDDNVVNITDGIYSLNFQFLGGPRPVNPFPACGQDPTSDDLPCDTTRC